MKHVLITCTLTLIASTAYAQDQQLGGRAKAMGGSYSAFEDDPVLIWMNPGGIATQPDQAAVVYQTYTAYPVEQERGPGDSISTDTQAETILVDPAIIPSYLGAVFQLGTPEAPMAVGISYSQPYHLNYALDRVLDPDQLTFVPEDNVEQSFARFRLAFAYDFRFLEVGDQGWFSHLAVGVGLDIGFINWEFTSSSGAGDQSDSSTSFGYGIGFLLGVFDNTQDLKINFGIAYQSAVEFEFNIDPDILPAFDMPQQLNLGLVFYLLEGTPLRATIDFQWIDWSATAEEPVFAGHPLFEDAFNFSIGFEYRLTFPGSETTFIYPRIGYRRFDAPWEDEDNLPMTGTFKLVLDTKGEAFNIFTFGAGLSWSTESGKIRSLDFGIDVGGDSTNAALGMTIEF